MTSANHGIRSLRLTDVGFERILVRFQTVNGTFDDFNPELSGNVVQYSLNIFANLFVVFRVDVLGLNDKHTLFQSFITV